MLKPIAKLAGVAVAGVALFKLISMLLLPLLGMFLGFLVWGVKIAIIFALIWWGYHLFKKWNEGGKSAEA